MDTVRQTMDTVRQTMDTVRQALLQVIANKGVTIGKNHINIYKYI